MNIQIPFIKNILLLTTLLLPLAGYSATSTATLPAVGTSEIVGSVDDLKIEIIVQGPSSQETPLQIICLFEYTDGDIFLSPPALPKDLNGLVHIDDAFKGLLTTLRKYHHFDGESLETLLIIPPPNTIPAKKLLMIGMGNRNDFTPDVMESVGITGMREALRLGVASYAHASDIKDAGISSPTAETAGYIVQGAIEGYRTQKYLLEQNASEPLTVKKVSILCGPTYFEDTKTGIKKVISSLSK